VVLVDVWLGAPLTGRMACPREVEQIVVAEDPELTLGRVHDRLALTGVGSTEPAGSGGTGFAGAGAGNTGV
jgi:hypothetical protein